MWIAACRLLPCASLTFSADAGQDSNHQIDRAAPGQLRNGFGPAVIQVARDSGTGLRQGCGLPFGGLRTLHAAFMKKGASRLVVRCRALEKFTLNHAFERANTASTVTRAFHPSRPLNRVGPLHLPC